MKGEPDEAHKRLCGADLSGQYHGKATKDYGAARAQDPSAVKASVLKGMVERRVAGWKKTCKCDTEELRRPLVCDPFCGSGTVGVVAKRHGCDFIGIDLNPEYLELARARIEQPSNGKPKSRGLARARIGDSLEANQRAEGALQMTLEW